jgi:hypothetical protein
MNLLFQDKGAGKEHCARSTQRASLTLARGATSWRLPPRRCSRCREKAACSSSHMARRRGGSVEVGGDCSPARRQLSRGHFEEDCAPHLPGDARIQPPVRCDRGIDPLGRKLGLPYPRRGDLLCSSTDRARHLAVVHGHSSHHVKTAEIHSDHLALYDVHVQRSGDFRRVCD